MFRKKGDPQRHLTLSFKRMLKNAHVLLLTACIAALKPKRFVTRNGGAPIPHKKQIKTTSNIKYEIP